MGAPSPGGVAERLRRLEDIEAIRNLIASYGPAVDRGDASGAAAAWAETGEYDIGGYGSHRGRAAIEAILDGDTHHDLIDGGAGHLLGPCHVVLDGDAATAVALSVVFRRAGDTFEAWRVSANRWRLVRSSDGWQIVRRENRTLDGSEAARALFR